MSATEAQRRTLHLCLAAMLMALVVVCCSFSIPVPGGHLYLCDVVICTAAILLDPLTAFVVGGVGSMLGDMLFYPAPMFVSLVAHGLQALLISLATRYLFKHHPILASGVGVAVGSLVMVVGYTLGRAYIYGPAMYGDAAVATSLMKLPFEILQAAVGAVGGMVLCWPLGLKKAFHRICGE